MAIRCFSPPESEFELPTFRVYPSGRTREKSAHLLQQRTSSTMLPTMTIFKTLSAGILEIRSYIFQNGIVSALPYDPSAYFPHIIVVRVLLPAPDVPGNEPRRSPSPILNTLQKSVLPSRGKSGPHSHSQILGKPFHPQNGNPTFFGLRNRAKSCPSSFVPSDTWNLHIRTAKMRWPPVLCSKTFRRLEPSATSPFDDNNKGRIGLECARKFHSMAFSSEWYRESNGF